MTSTVKIAVAAISGVTFGALVVQGLHAQAKPPVFHITMQDVSDAAALSREFVPVARETIRKAGGKPIAGSAPIMLDGAKPAQRVAIVQWQSIEQMRAWWDSEELKKAREIGNKYAKFTVFAVEGVPAP